MADPNSTRKRTNFKNLTEEEILAHRKAKKSEFDKRYREKHKESHLAKKKIYREENKEKVSQGKKDWYKKNSDLVINKVRQYEIDNKEKISANKKIYREKNKTKQNLYMVNYYLSNKEKVYAINNKWKEKNKARVLALKRKRVATKLNATPKWCEHEAIELIYKEAALLKYHVDHIVPLVSKLVCGLHVLSNIQILPPTDNMKKGNRYWPDMP